MHQQGLPRAESMASGPLSPYNPHTTGTVLIAKSCCQNNGGMTGSRPLDEAKAVLVQRGEGTAPRAVGTSLWRSPPQGSF